MSVTSDKLEYAAQIIEQHRTDISDVGAGAESRVQGFFRSAKTCLMKADDPELVAKLDDILKPEEVLDLKKAGACVLVGVVIGGVVVYIWTKTHPKDSSDEEKSKEKEPLIKFPKKEYIELNKEEVSDDSDVR